MGYFHASDYIPYDLRSDSADSNNVKNLKLTMCPLSRRKLQLCAFMIRGGKKITDVRFCGHASPNLHVNFKSAQFKLDAMTTRHAEIGTLNCLTEKQRQTRLLKKTTLIVVRFSQRNVAHKQRKKHKKGNFSDEEISFELILSNSKPCSQCIKVLKLLQLKAVIYVDENGQLIKQKPIEIEDCVDSHGTKKMFI
mmetsp:Transcript_31127/g.50496  ORF Transcript_31127/g.50496 Transcript_31127/m.50496 type:complete len:194 (+) Transcript_31127:310-891(+)